MGFLSTLGKIGKFAGIAAAPFTGGASLALTALGTAGDIASNVAAGRAKGREDEFGANLTQAAHKDRAMLDRAQLEMDRNKAARVAQSDDMSKIMRGNMISNMQTGIGQTARPAGVPTMTFKGGLNAGMLGPEAKAGGAEMSRAALMSMLNGGDKVSDVPMQDYDAMMPKSGILDKILSTVGTVGGFAGAMAPSYAKQASQAPAAAPIQPNVFRKIQF